MQETLRTEMYRLVGEFLDAINAGDVEHLTRKFGLSPQILEEIQEVMNIGPRPPNPKLGLAPYKQAFEQGSRSRPSIEFFRMNDAASWGVEFSLWIDGRESELILHAVVSEGAEGLAFNYGYIGS
jgi:hypothetical protein